MDFREIIPELEKEIGEEKDLLKRKYLNTVVGEWNGDNLMEDSDYLEHKEIRDNLLKKYPGLEMELKELGNKMVEKIEESCKYNIAKEHEKINSKIQSLTYEKDKLLFYLQEYEYGRDEHGIGDKYFQNNIPKRPKILTDELNKIIAKMPVLRFDESGRMNLNKITHDELLATLSLEDMGVILDRIDPEGVYSAEDMLKSILPFDKSLRLKNLKESIQFNHENSINELEQEKINVEEENMSAKERLKRREKDGKFHYKNGMIIPDNVINSWYDYNYDYDDYDDDINYMEEVDFYDPYEETSINQLGFGEEGY
jgi:hypothetical protein